MKKIIIPAVLLAVSGFLFWWFSAEQVLKRRVASMIDAAQVPATMSDAGRKARGTHVAKFLAKQLHLVPPEGFDLPVSDRVNRDTATALYSGAASYAKEMTFTDLHVEEVDVRDAEADVRFRVDGIIDLRSRRPVDGILHVESRWEKADGVWLLGEVSWTEGSR
jgi:hypothetical protein